MGNLNARRQAKIERFKAEREIKGKLEQIESKRRVAGGQNVGSDTRLCERAWVLNLSYGHGGTGLY